MIEHERKQFAPVLKFVFTFEFQKHAPQCVRTRKIVSVLCFLFFFVVCLDWRESDDKPRLEINLPPTHILLMLAV